MLVSTNAFLQSIKDNNKQTIDQTVNKTGVKSAAKEANEALNKPNANILQQQQQSKPATIESTISQTLQTLAKNGASKETILNTLKNSAVFANLGSVSNDLKALTNMLKSDPVLAKFEPVLAQFMKSIENIDEKTLVSNIKNSGVFLEAKLANVSTKGTFPKPIADLLQNISNELTKIEPNLAKPVQQQITQLLNQPISQNPTTIQEALQKVVTQLQNLIQSQQPQQNTQLQNLFSQLQNVSKDAMLVESKIQNSLQVNPEIQTKLTTQIKAVLTNLQQTIQNAPNLQNAPMMNKIIDHLLNQPVLLNTSKSVPNVSIPTINSTMEDIAQSVKNIVNNINIPQEVKTQLVNTLKDVQNLMQQFEQAKTNIDKLSVLDQLKTQLTQMKQNSEPNSLLQSKVEQMINNQIPTKALETLQQSLQQNIAQLNSNSYMQKNTSLQQITQQIDNVIGQLKNPTLQNIASIQDQLQQIVQMLKNTPNMSNTATLVDNLISQAKPMANEMLLQSNFTQNVSNLVSLFKNEVLQNQPNNVMQQFQPLMQKLEAMIQPNVMQQLIDDKNPANIKQMLQQDFKSVLLQMQDEVKNLDTPVAKDVQKQVDRLLGQIEYFQAYSFASNTQNTFMPFVWDMMKEGEISFKKLKEDRFFVQINLKLKDLGKVDMMVILHDKNQLDISIFAQRKIFKTMVQTTLPKLKQAINQVGLIPFQIKLLDMQEDEAIKNETNAFVQQEQIGMGLNIKV